MVITTKSCNFVQIYELNSVMSQKAQKHISMEEYNYSLPDERVAKYPLEQRDNSKLLLWHNGDISESHFNQIDRYLPENSLLVYNNTKVIHARLLFQKPTGAKIEIFCLEPLSPFDYARSLSAQGSCEWKCMVGNLKKWKQGALEQRIEAEGERVNLQAELQESMGNAHRIKFSWDSSWSFSEVLMQIGQLPIPPYLNRHTEEKDKETYQTVYSRIEGSVAAPTAGLHFTEEVLQSLKKKQIETEELTLHVGAGTFQPVKSDNIEQHTMHTESFIVNDATIEKLLSKLGHIIAVGTTSVRALESLYYIGVQILDGNYELKNGKFHISQWEAYQREYQNISVRKALIAIQSYLQEKSIAYLQAETQILIKPGFQFRVIEGMITNFHQPKSTLLLLVSAYVGDDWHRIYDYAMNHDFRFLSYGDSSFLLK